MRDYAANNVQFAVFIGNSSNVYYGNHYFGNSIKLAHIHWCGFDATHGWGLSYSYRQRKHSWRGIAFAIQNSNNEPFCTDGIDDF